MEKESNFRSADSHVVFKVALTCAGVIIDSDPAIGGSHFKEFREAITDIRLGLPGKVGPYAKTTNIPKKTQ